MQSRNFFKNWSKIEKISKKRLTLSRQYLIILLYLSLTYRLSGIVPFLLPRGRCRFSVFYMSLLYLFWGWSGFFYTLETFKIK